MRTLLAAIILLAATAFVAAPAVPRCKGSVHVGAWNIQWLGNAQAGRRRPQDPHDVAAYIAAGQVDVLGLAEISATGRGPLGQARNQTLDAAFDILNATGAKWRYLLFAKRPGARAPEDQWTGLAWNAAVVSLTGGPWRLGVAVNAQREAQIRARLDSPASGTVILSRWPYAAEFSAGPGKTDFIVVPVHLKSNIGGPATAEARAYEVELIAEGLERLGAQHHDDDLVVLGDSNMLVATEPAAAGLAAMGLKDCNARDLATHLSVRGRRKAAPFDRIFLAARQPETEASCPASGRGRGRLDFKIVRPADWQPGMRAREFRRRLSDHLMVRAGICVMADDD